MIVRMIVARTLGGVSVCPGGVNISPGGPFVSPGGHCVSPASAETESTKVKATANMKRFMRVTPYLRWELEPTTYQ